MTKKELEQEIIECHGLIKNHEAMLLEGENLGKPPISQIKENIHYWTGRRDAYRHVLEVEVEQ